MLFLLLVLSGPPAFVRAEYIAGLDGVSLSSTLETDQTAALPEVGGHGWTDLDGAARFFDLGAAYDGRIINATEPYGDYTVRYVPATETFFAAETRYALTFHIGYTAGNPNGVSEYSFSLGTLQGGVFTPLATQADALPYPGANVFEPITLEFVTGATPPSGPLAVQWSQTYSSAEPGSSDWLGFNLVTLNAGPDVADTTPPELVAAAAGLPGQVIALTFNETLDETSALSPAAYSFGGGVTVVSAALHSEGKGVLLYVSGLSGETFTGTFTNVRDVAGNAANGPLSGPVVPLISADVGLLNEPGQAFPLSGESWLVSAGGVDVWGIEDSFHFAWQERTGDFDVAVRVDRFGPSQLPAIAKALLMVREDTEPGSRHLSLTTYPVGNNWTAYQRQESYGVSSVLPGEWRVGWGAGANFPVWLRVRRAGNTFSTYGSVTGEVWTQIGDAVVPDTPYAETVLVGVGVTSTTDLGANPQTAAAVFSHFGDFSLPGGTVTFEQHPASLTVAENTPATFTASVQVTGAAPENVIYQWFRNGEPITGPNAPTYTIPLTALTDSGASFTLRASLPGGSSVTSNPAVLTVTPDTLTPTVLGASSVGGGSVLVRFSETVDPSNATDPANYRLTPAATIYEALLQPDGASVVLVVDALVGTSFTLAIDGVSDLAGNVIDASVTGEILSWLSEDIGAVNLPSIVISPEPGVYEVTSAGADIWLAADSFHFLYEEKTGDFDVRVQLAGITLANPSARGGLMVREDLSPESRNLFAGTYAVGGQNNWVATVRAETGATTTLGPGESFPVRAADFAFPNAWFRLLRAGQTFTSFYSTDGVTWIQLGDQITPEPPYPNTVSLGMATASINLSVATTARYQHYGPLAPTSVELEITRLGENIVLSWPESAEGFALHTTPDFVLGHWTSVPTTPVLSGGRYQVTLPAALEAHFYRLQK